MTVDRGQAGRAPAHRRGISPALPPIFTLLFFNLHTIISYRSISDSNSPIFSYRYILFIKCSPHFFLGQPPRSAIQVRNKTRWQEKLVDFPHLLWGNFTSLLLSPNLVLPGKAVDQAPRKIGVCLFYPLATVTSPLCGALFQGCRRNGYSLCNRQGAFQTERRLGWRRDPA